MFPLCESEVTVDVIESVAPKCVDPALLSEEVESNPRFRFEVNPSRLWVLSGAVWSEENPLS